MEEQNILPLNLIKLISNQKLNLLFMVATSSLKKPKSVLRCVIITKKNVYCRLIKPLKTKTGKFFFLKSWPLLN